MTLHYDVAQGIDSRGSYSMGRLEVSRRVGDRWVDVMSVALRVGIPLDSRSTWKATNDGG